MKVLIINAHVFSIDFNEGSDYTKVPEYFANYLKYLPDREEGGWDAEPKPYCAISESLLLGTGGFGALWNPYGSLFQPSRDLKLYLKLFLLTQNFIRTL